MQVSRLQVNEYAFQNSKCLQVIREFRGKIKLKLLPKTFNLLHVGKICPYCQVCKTEIHSEMQSAKSLCL